MIWVKNTQGLAPVGPPGLCLGLAKRVTFPVLSLASGSDKASGTLAQGIKNVQMVWCKG